MANILSTIGQILTAVVGWMGQTVSAIFTSTTVDGVTTYTYGFLVLCVLVPFIFLGVSLLRRLTRV